ncbi:MAG: ribosome biogenesis GTP-binding protein YihA/YsxC [Hyphomicrobiaceae bacterium]
MMPGARVSGGDGGLADLGLAAADVELGRLLFERQWTFLRGVTKIDDLPAATVSEIAFAGRSNVGKSSLINALVRQAGLARTSNVPGRTQELNYFVSERVPLALVDMPGYGFARAPKDKVDTWTALIKDYLRGRPTLRRVMLLIDSRHGIKPVDTGIMRLLDESAVIYQIVLTKIDKIKEPGVPKLIAATQAAIQGHPAAFPGVIATSSEKQIGIDTLRGAIAAAGLITPESL